MEFCKNGKKIYKESKRLIKKAQMNKQLVLFVGAGASVDSGMPLWKDAVAAIATKMESIQCLSPAKKYKLYKSSINKSIHFVQRILSSSTRG